MESFGILGMVFGMSALAFALMATQKIDKLVKQLKESGVLDKEYESDSVGK